MKFIVEAEKRFNTDGDATNGEDATSTDGSSIYAGKRKEVRDWGLRKLEAVCRADFGKARLLSTEKSDAVLSKGV